MKTAEYYVKVKIESTDDLPKKDGKYPAMTKGGSFVNFKHHANLPFHMLGRIDWYLLPVEQIELPSDKEICKQASLYSQAFESGYRYIADTDFTNGAKWAVKWIKDKMK